MKRTVVHQQNTEKEFGPVAVAQGPRVFVNGEGKSPYVVFNNTIALLEPATYRLTSVVHSPITIDSGGDYLGGRIYFVAGSHLYSYKLPTAGSGS